MKRWDTSAPRLVYLEKKEIASVVTNQIVTYQKYSTQLLLDCRYTSEGGAARDWINIDTVIWLLLYF